MYPYQSGGSIVKQQILDVIKSAKFTIDVCVYNNSDADIVSALKLARNKDCEFGILRIKALLILL
jgi:phosphatidylserine/phosphatidylglycerophosphate/cardiolipin synthase-like enzyme